MLAKVLMSNFELNQKSKLFSSENDYNFEIVLKRCTASAHDLRSIKSCIKLMWPPRLEFSWDGLHHNNSKQKHSTSIFTSGCMLISMPNM